MASLVWYVKINVIVYFVYMKYVRVYLYHASTEDWYENENILKESDTVDLRESNGGTVLYICHLFVFRNYK